MALKYNNVGQGLAPAGQAERASPFPTELRQSTLKGVFV